METGLTVRDDDGAGKFHPSYEGQRSLTQARQANQVIEPDERTSTTANSPPGPLRKKPTVKGGRR